MLLKQLYNNCTTKKPKDFTIFVTMKTVNPLYHILTRWFLLCTFTVQAQEAVYQNFEDIKFEQVAVDDDDGLTLRESGGQIYEDENGIIWTVISTGLFRYNGYSVINVTDYLSAKYHLKFGSEFGNCFYIEDVNTVWYGARRGLFKIDLKQHSAKQIVLDSTINEKNFKNYITRFQKSNDTLYVGTGNGIYLINTSNGRIMDTFLNDGIDYGFRFSSKNVHSMMPDVEPGFLWAALGDGFYKINLKTKQIEHYTTKTEVWDYSHYYFHGERYDNTLLMPSYGMGMVSFDLNSKTFIDYSTNTTKGNGWEYNIIRSAVRLSDTLSLVNASNLGYALFNRHAKTYNFLETPSVVEEDGAFIDVDRSGYAWSGQSGRLYRTTKPIVKTQNLFKHIIDIAKLSANGVIKYRPALDGYENLELNENETNVELRYSVTKPYIYDTVQYEYRKDSDQWLQPEKPNILTFFNLENGNHQIDIRAKHNGTILAARTLTFNIYQPFYKSVYFIPLCLILVFAIALTLREFQIRRKRKQIEIKADFDRKLNELEAKALRSQINPHFIFNTLNSIKYYAIMKSKEETTDFLTMFSTLIRQVLENSKQSLIPLNEEIETLTSYLEIEKLRLRNSFEYFLTVDDQIPKDFLVPPMIIQPFIENAVWHGLMHREKDRKLTVEFLGKEKRLRCIITDNGIGRKAAQEISKNKSHKSSLGIDITNERLEKLSELYDLKSHFEIIDLYNAQGEPSGTRVIIEFQNL